MKFCYLDESGTGGEPIAVMVGVITDAHRMHVTKEAWLDLLKKLSGIIDCEINEFHAHRFYSGAGIWRPLDGQTRSRIMTAIIDWMAERKHKVVYSAIDISKFKAKRKTNKGLKKLPLWCALALHVALSVQRLHQKESKTKGHTVLIFDEAVKEKEKFTSLLLTPPKWTEGYYQRGKKQPVLDQLIDVPHFVNSKHVALVQVADLYAYLLRRHFELEMQLSKPKYGDELKKVGKWGCAILSQTIPSGNIYPKKGVSDAAQLFQSLAPDCCL